MAILLNGNKNDRQQNEATHFIESLKRAGLLIGDKRKVVERLGGTREWHYAFSALAKQGKTLGFSFLLPSGLAQSS